MKKKLFLLTAVLAVAIIFLLVTNKPNQESGIQIHASVEEASSPEADAKVPDASATADPAVTEASETKETDPADEDDATAEPAKEQPFLVQITDDDPSIAYVLVRMPDPIGLLPLPLEGEYTRTIRQTAPDGTEAINVLHLTPDGFRMEEANCEGHDCVKQGEVTLENREERILWNMIICLPHQLSLELITREEALQMIGR